MINNTIQVHLTCKVLGRGLVSAGNKLLRRNRAASLWDTNPEAKTLYLKSCVGECWDAVFTEFMRANSNDSLSLSLDTTKEGLEHEAF